jgi:hypothetical protein
MSPPKSPAWSSSGLKTGLCHVFIQHTSASLMINENADPDVLVDLETFFSELVPDGDPRYIHTAEGPDDMRPRARCPDPDQPEHPDRQRPPGPGHLAGHLSCGNTAIGRIGGAWSA